jgi:predicted metal-binding membrane protein
VYCGADPAVARIGARDQLSRLAWRHPEWWSLALCAAAWLALIASTADGAAPQAWARHAIHDAPAASPILDGGRWLTMVVAMMVPLVLEPIRTTAARSLWRRRHQAIGGFLAGYVVPWLLAGLAFAISTWTLSVAIGAAVRSWWPMAFVLAAVWQLAPAKRRALVSCHETRPLAPHGWPALRDCFSFGWMVGVRCVATCWALMLVCVLGGHSLTIMAGIAALGAAERTSRHATPRVTCGLLLAAATISLIADRIP